MQIGSMLIAIEQVLLSESPDAVLVYGDTNSTLAGALAATKLGIKVIHVETGLRSFDMHMPEEQNRILTDHISTLLFCPTYTAVKNLKKENIINGVFEVGDVMCDAVLHFSDIPNADKILKEEIKSFFYNRISIDLPDSWYLTTIHRAENTDDIIKLQNIFAALEQLDKKAILPVHPRIATMVRQLNEDNNYNNIIFIKPVGYISMLQLIKKAKKVITDSGGLQKESYILGIPCLTIRDHTEWVETLNDNFNILAKPLTIDIIDKISIEPANTKQKPYYGNGDASKKICDIIESYFKFENL